MDLKPSEEMVKKFRKDRKYMLSQLRMVVVLLREIADEFNLYSDQRSSDIARGVLKIGGVEVPLHEGWKSIFIDHFPMEYLQGVAILLEHFNKSGSTFGQWLTTRTILETIYDRAKVSLIDDSKLNSHQKQKVGRYRALQILDFHLHTSAAIGIEPWISDYATMRQHVGGLAYVLDEDIAVFPEADKVKELNRRMTSDRGRLLNKLPKEFALKSPMGNELIYDIASRLAHGNAMQLAMSKFTATQWREQLLIDGRVIQACIDLLGFIFDNMKIESLAKVQKRGNTLEAFYLDRLVPNWRLASEVELGPAR